MINRKSRIFKEKRYVNRYAGIIIRKFGKETALKYANSDSTCPCAMQEIVCETCEHSRGKLVWRHTGCKQAENFRPGISREIKQKIKDRLET